MKSSAQALVTYMRQKLSIQVESPPHFCTSRKAPFLSLSPNLTLPESLQKNQFCILGHYFNFLPFCCQQSKFLPEHSAFDHTWAQTQLVVDRSSPLAYNL